MSSLILILATIAPTQAPVQAPVQKQTAVQKSDVARRTPVRRGLRAVNPFKACRFGSCG